MTDRLNDWLGEMRPRLHRYAARMMGSAFDGEDVVQDALAKAAEALGAGAEVAEPDAWIFRIVHNTALDALRRRRRQEVRDALAVSDDATTDEADRRIAVEAGLNSFLHLVPAQRSTVALVDVLGHSLAETATILGMTVPAVKAALHRGRARLRELAHQVEVAAVIAPAERERLRAYADRFNAHDWDALRALLADDVKLDLANRSSLSGARDVSVYFTRYAALPDWRASVGMAEGRPALLIRKLGNESGTPVFLVLLDWRGDRIAAIRDFHFATYIMDGLSWSTIPPA